MFKLMPYDPDLRETDSALEPPVLPMHPALQQKAPAQNPRQILSLFQKLHRINPLLILLATVWSIGGIFALLPLLASPDTIIANALQIVLGMGVWLGGLIAILVGGTLLILRMTDSLSYAPIVRCSTDRMRRGDRLDLTYNQKFKKETRIHSLSFSFSMRESVTFTTSSDTKTITYSWVFADEQRSARVIQPGGVLEERISLEIPSRAMHSFVTRHNRIQWFVTVKLDVPGGPDINNVYEVIVLPEAKSV